MPIEREDEPEDREERRPRRRPSDDDRPSRRDDYDDYDDRPRRRRPREPEIGASDFLIPTDVSGWSIASCYFRALSCIFPLVGFVLALVALPCGIKALRQTKKKSSSYGSVTGNVRAIIGVVCSSLTIVGHLIIGVFYLIGSIK